MRNSGPGPHLAAGNSGQPLVRRLESWKEIAAYLKRDVTTVQRWEKREGLPIHRHFHAKLGTVYAYQSEVDAWWNRSRRPESEPPPAPPRRRRWWWALPVLLASAAIGILVPRRASPPRQMVARQVWSELDLDQRVHTVSPDGRFLAYTDPATLELFLFELAGGRRRRLTYKDPRFGWQGAQYAAFSPDSKRLAYAWINREVFLELHVVGIDGAGERLVYRDPDVFYLRVQDWSPDGAQVLASLRHRDGRVQMALIRVTDGSLRVLQDLDWREPDRMSFSPDGRYVAYDLPAGQPRYQHDIYVLPLAPGGGLPLVEHRGEDFLLGWAPNGKTILFASDRSGTADAWSIRVTAGRPQGAPEFVKKDIGPMWPVGFTRSGIYYYGLRTGTRDFYVAVLDPEDGKLVSAPVPAAQRFTGFNKCLDWSRDGRFVAFAAQQLPWQHSRIIVRALASEAERELQPDLNYVETLRWSPNGRLFLATGTDRQDRQGLYQVDAVTGRTVALRQDRDATVYAVDAAWSPDGARIYYKLRDMWAEPGRLRVRDSRTGDDRELIPAVYQFALSHDGQSLAFTSYDARRVQRLEILPAGGGAAREVCRWAQPGRIVSLAWTVDGRQILYACRNQLWRVAAAGGEPAKLPLAMEGLQSLQFHPDGRRLAFSAGRDRGEIWVLENFLK